MAEEYFDVVIVGAGLSGIGTWDLFRYPGIRSDSDMYTLGYNFKPWKEGKAIAEYLLKGHIRIDGAWTCD